jgi:hypothetical protein
MNKNPRAGDQDDNRKTMQMRKRIRLHAGAYALVQGVGGVLHARGLQQSQQCTYIASCSARLDIAITSPFCVTTA